MTAVDKRTSRYNTRVVRAEILSINSLLGARKHCKGSLVATRGGIIGTSGVHGGPPYNQQPMDHIRYSVAADIPNPLDRRAMRADTDRILSMIDSAVAGAAPFLPVRLVVFPEFAHSAPVFPTAAELIEKLAVKIPNEHCERLEQKAREHNIYIQSGTMLEVDPKWAGVVFNTSCLIGPEGILYKYRKVNTWIPYEVHASPHDLDGYDEPLFPVADTPIGRIGCAICYDWIFPERSGN